MTVTSVEKEIIVGGIILVLLIRQQLVPRRLSGKLLLLSSTLGIYALYSAASNSQVQDAGWVSLILTILSVSSSA